MSIAEAGKSSADLSDEPSEARASREGRSTFE